MNNDSTAHVRLIDEPMTGDPHELLERSSSVERSTGDMPRAVDMSFQQPTSYETLAKAQPMGKRRLPSQSHVPDTVTILHDEATDGTIYLVGTAHFR